MFVQTSEWYRTFNIPSYPGHGNSKCCIVGNWTCFSFLKIFTSHPRGFISSNYLEGSLQVFKLCESVFTESLRTCELWVSVLLGALMWHHKKSFLWGQQCKHLGQRRRERCFEDFGTARTASALIQHAKSEKVGCCSSEPLDSLIGGVLA